MEMTSESKAEQQVAEFLSELTLVYESQPKLTINDQYHKEKTVSPDFFLPAFGVYLEVCGAQRNDYYNGKKEMYEANNIKVIFIETYKPEEKWKLYFLARIIQIQREQQYLMLSSLLKKYSKNTIHAC
jgi:hypothetical protein